MAAPEIDLASDNDFGRFSEVTTSDDDGTKANPRDGSTSDSIDEDPREIVLDESSPIVYHYLTFNCPAVAFEKYIYRPVDGTSTASTGSQEIHISF
jgi:hypothetical protein